MVRENGAAGRAWKHSKIASRPQASANTPLLRNTTVEYGGDGTGSEMAPRLDSAGNTINPRTISNLVFDQDESVLNGRGLTSFVFQWGQFLDHDLDLTEAPASGPFEDISFLVPTDGTESELPPGTVIPQVRSRFVLDEDGIRQQVNQVSSFIDASNVYGSDGTKADGLRSHFGGFLLTSDGVTNNATGGGQFLPFNTLGLENAAPPVTGLGRRQGQRTARPDGAAHAVRPGAQLPGAADRRGPAPERRRPRQPPD
jgi:hypothetical protein